MEPVIEQIKVSQAVRLSRQFVGYGNRSTFYRWMNDLSVTPDGGVINKLDLALVCTFGKALREIGSRPAAARAVLKAKANWTEAELCEFAFNPHTTFQQIEVKYAS